MVQRTLEVTLMSAKDLNKVNFFTKMDVYAVLFISGDNSTKKVRSPVDKEGGRNPTWNFTVKFDIDEGLLQQNRVDLVVKVMSERVFGDKEIGEVRVGLKDVLDSPGGGKRFVSYQVRKPDGKTKGFVSFSYDFGAKVEAAKVDQSVTAYPHPNLVGPSSGAYPPTHDKVGVYPPPTEHGATTDNVGAYPPPPGPHVATPDNVGAYPPSAPAVHGATVAGYAPPPQYAYPAQPYPPQQQTGYGYPPQQQMGYGYPPQQAGYGYIPQPVVQPAKKSNKLGMGLGAGLIGGAIGGMLLGDMISDVADVAAYDAGFDAGAYDAGFDF